MMDKHIGDRIGGSLDFKPSTLFGTHEYIATDYNKKSDIHKAHLEDERNLNASFSRKPFKTQSYTHQAPTETYYFNIKKKIKAGNNISSNNLDDIDCHLLERTHGALHVPDPKADSKLRKLKRNVYSTDEKEKILKGHLHGQRGIENISSTGDRKQMKKSTAILKEWSTRIFVDLAENWPNLHFQIKVKDNDCDDGDGTMTAPLHSTLNSSSLFDTHKSNVRGVKRQGHRGEAEELLIQFDTDIQILPPEKALSRYMAHLASHGSAADFGLQRNCDRWGILEKGYIETPQPVRKSHEVMLRIVEFPVKRIEKSYNLITEKNQTGSMNEINLPSNNISGSSSPYRQDKGMAIINRSHSDDTYVRDSPLLPVLLKSSDKSDPQRDITTEEIEDRVALRVLLYRAFDLSEDFSKHITEAISKVRGDFPSLGSYDRQDMLDRESISARLPQSARSNNGIKESARGLLGRNGDSARGGFGVPTMHTVLLTNSIKVVCVVTDAVPESSSKIPTVTSYDINGRPYMRSIGQSEIACFNSSSTSADIATHQELNKSGFTLNYEEGSSASELFESLGKSLSASLKSSSSLDGIQVGHAGQGGNRVRKEFRIVVSVTGKWMSAVNPVSFKDLATSPISTRNYQSPLVTPLSPHVTVQPMRNTEVASDLSPISDEHKKRSNDSFDVSCSQINVPIPDLLTVPLISLRTLLKSSKNFTYIEQGKNNLHSHKEKLKEKARLDIIASKELKKQDYRNTSSSAVRKKVEIIFSLTDLTDTVQLTERLISCIVKAAGLLPYHLIEGPKMRRGSMKGGDPAATGLSVYDGNQHETTATVPSSIIRSLSNPISRPFEGNQKTAVRLEEDIGRIGVEDVPNGMREANLLTFAFYAPWVKSSQLNASKKEANSIRQKTRLLQEQERVEKLLWRRRAEMLLFGTPVDPRISDLTLQAGGGLIGMKWLISNIDLDMEKDMEGDPDQDRGEYTDILSDMAPTMSPYASIGRRSFNNNNSQTDRSIGTGRRTSNHRKSNSMSSMPSNSLLNQSRDTSTVPISFPVTVSAGSSAVSDQGLNINVGRDRDNNKRKGISAKSGQSDLSSRSYRTDSLAHVLGIRGNYDRDFSDDVGAHCEAKTLRGQDLVSEVYNLSSQSDRSMDNRTVGARKLEMHKVLSKRRLSKGLLIDADLIRESGQGLGNNISASRQHQHRLSITM